MSAVSESADLEEVTTQVLPDVTDSRDAYCGFREETWCVLVHLSALFPFLAGIGMIVPVLMWQWSSGQSELARRHSARMINWVFTATAAMILLALMMLIPFTFVRYLLALPGTAIVVLSAFLPIVASRKADQGELWSYPGAIRFIRED